MIRHTSICLTLLIFLSHLLTLAAHFRDSNGASLSTFDDTTDAPYFCHYNGTTTLAYQGNSGSVLSAIPTAGPKVLMDYGTAAEGFRLKKISNQTSADAIVSQHHHTFTKNSQIATWNRAYGLGTSPPAAETVTFDYDAADRLAIDQRFYV